jgi:hypothetical protein
MSKIKSVDECRDSLGNLITPSSLVAVTHTNGRSASSIHLGLVTRLTKHTVFYIRITQTDLEKGIATGNHRYESKGTPDKTICISSLNTSLYDNSHYLVSVSHRYSANDRSYNYTTRSYTDKVVTKKSTEYFIQKCGSIEEAQDLSAMDVIQKDTYRSSAVTPSEITNCVAIPIT